MANYNKLLLSYIKFPHIFRIYSKKVNYENFVLFCVTGGRGRDGNVF